MRFLRLPLLVLLALVFITASGWAKIDTVKMVDFTFQPASLTILPGDTVVWKVTQSCCDLHTTTRTSAPLTWDSGPMLLNATFLLVFPGQGTFNYVCTPHEFGGMVGTITVQSPKAPVLGWLGLGLLLASLTVTGIWMLQQRRQPA